MKNNKTNKTWEIIYMVCDVILVVCGILGFALNLIHIDELIVNHFGWFVVMNVVYLTMFVLGMTDLEEE